MSFSTEVQALTTATTDLLMAVQNVLNQLDDRAHLNWRGNWVASTEYVFNPGLRRDYFIGPDGTGYVTLKTHTSTDIDTDFEDGNIGSNDAVRLLADLASTNTGQGAEMVQWLHPANLAQPRSLSSRLADRLSLLDFMTLEQRADALAGTKTLDMSAPLQAAVDWLCASGGHLDADFQIRIDSPILGECNNTALTVSISGGRDWDFSSASFATGANGTKTAFTIGGSLGASAPLSVDVSKGSFQVNTNLSVAVGDYIKIESTDLWEPTRPYYVKGEMRKVVGVSGSVISLERPLYDEYTAATTTVTKMNMPRVIAQGISLISNSNHIGFVIQYARDVDRRGCSARGFRYSCGYVTQCFGGAVTLEKSSDAWYSGTGTSYGHGVDSCQEMWHIGNSLIGGRHALTYGGTFPVRDCVAAYNQLFNNAASSPSMPLDVHENGEYITLAYNTTGGAVVNGRNCRVLNNVFKNSQTGISAILNLSIFASCDFHEIKGNTFENVGASGQTVWVSFFRDSAEAPASITVKRIDISGNSGIGLTGNGIRVSPRNTASNNCKIETLTLSNNSIQCTGAVNALQIAGVSTTDIAVDEIYINGGRYESLTSTSITIVATTKSNIKTVRCDGAVVRAGGTGYGSNFSGTDVALKSCVFDGNASRLGTRARSIRFLNTNTTDISSCEFSNFSTGNGVELDVTGPITLLDLSNRYINTGTQIPLNSSGAQHIGALLNFGRKVVYVNAVPSISGFTAGDRAINYSGTIGQPKGWIFSTGGAWVSEGNL